MLSDWLKPWLVMEPVGTQWAIRNCQYCSNQRRQTKSKQAKKLTGQATLLDKQRTGQTNNERTVAGRGQKFLVEKRKKRNGERLLTNQRCLEAVAVHLWPCTCGVE